MRKALERLGKIKAPVCVTLVLKTHKTRPENQKDPILLKNLISEANQRLEKEYGVDIAKGYTEKLNELANRIDHSHNDHGLMLFVNDTVQEYLRLPTHLHTRVILDKTFATRPIIRSLKKDTDYYILVLSRGRARLLEANSDKLTREYEEEGFPITDNELVTFSNRESSHNVRMTNKIQEFFNRIDKSVNAIRSKNPLPIVIYSEDTNYHQYQKEADHPNIILGHILLKNFDQKGSNLVKEIWPYVKELRIEKNRARISELENAMSAGNYLSDLNEIWRAVKEARGKTIFVEEGYFQPVKTEKDVLTPIRSEEINQKEDINDIVDEMIELTLKFGGDVVFLEPGALKEFNKLALVTRY